MNKKEEIKDIISPDMSSNDIDTIADISGLDREEVKNIINDNGLWVAEQIQAMTDEEYNQAVNNAVNELI